MQNNVIDLAYFQAMLPSIDWSIDNQINNLLARANDRTSITFVADCYVSLPDHDAAIAKKLVRKRLPKQWKGWPVIVNAARRRRKAFENAIAIGVLSNDLTAENYHGHYFYWRPDKCKDLFKHNKTFACIESPYSIGEIRKFEAKRDYGFVPSKRS